VNRGDGCTLSLNARSFRWRLNPGVGQREKGRANLGRNGIFHWERNGFLVRVHPEGCPKTADTADIVRDAC